MKRSDPRSGVILVTVLWSIALLSALAMAASVTFRGFAGIMSVERDRVQGEALLSAGLETAASILDALGDAPLLENEVKVNLTTGSVQSRLTDEGGASMSEERPLKLSRRCCAPLALPSPRRLKSPSVSLNGAIPAMRLIKMLRPVRLIVRPRLRGRRRRRNWGSLFPTCDSSSSSAVCARSG